MVAVRHHEFSKCGIWSRDRCLNVTLLLRTNFHDIRTLIKNDFEYGGGPPYWICCDVIILHPVLYFMFLTLYYM